MTKNLERYQEKLEEKQAACLEQIRDMEKQVCSPSAWPRQSWVGFGLRRGLCLLPHQWVWGSLRWTAL